MIIAVHLHTTLQQSTPQGLVSRVSLSLPAGSALIDLIGVLNLQISEEDTLLVVNGRLAESSRVLQEGDEVHFIPALSGGSQ